jgi:hypothetical protein
MKFFIFLFLIPQLLFAIDFTGCGEYSIKGVIRAKEKGFVMIVNEKTASEITLMLSINEQARIAIFNDASIASIVILDQPFNGTIGIAKKVVTLEKRIPDPLNPSDTGLELVKKMDCKKD